MLNAGRLLILATSILLTVSSASADDANAGALQPGDVLDQSNAQKAEGLLPPEILQHYKDGGYANAIVDWPEDYFVWPTDFEAGSKANVGRFDIGEEGQVVEKATGKQPVYLIGFPFPEIDQQDPKAGIKIIWNFFYRTWYFGNSRNESQLNWVAPKKLERRTDVDVSFKYYDGVPEYEREENPQNFSVQFLTLVVSPSDLNGTANLSWRYLDPTKRDSSWAYVPALRRVRAVSPANRSDGFLGSDMSQDDGPFFDGKPEDFKWTLKGTKEQFRLIDPISLKGESKQSFLAGGGWRADWPDIPFLGYMDPKWTGLAWSPHSGALAKREHWVVEVVPEDRYYLFGKMEMYIDKKTFQGAWNRKFSWKGELLNTTQVMAFIPNKVTRPDSGRVEFVQGSTMAFQCVESIKGNQATVAGIKSTPKSGFDSHITFGPSFFETNSLSRVGK